MATCSTNTYKGAAPVFTEALKQIGAPTTGNNPSILMLWASYVCCTAAWNPLACFYNLGGNTAAEMDSGVVEYSSATVGGISIASQLQDGRGTIDNSHNAFYECPQFTALLAMLRTNESIDKWGPYPGLLTDIRNWGNGYDLSASDGSHAFATYLANYKAPVISVPAPAPAPTPAPAPAPTPSPTPAPAPVESSPGSSSTTAPVAEPITTPSPPVATPTSSDDVLGLGLLVGGGLLGGLFLERRRTAHGAPARSQSPEVRRTGAR